jgi:hypothetical protein
MDTVIPAQIPSSRSKVYVLGTLLNKPECNSPSSLLFPGNLTQESAQ